MRWPACAIGLVIVSVLASTGCGKHYWNKASASADDFTRDSMECAHENALYMSGTKDYGIVMGDRYKACLRGRGWVRAQHHEPPPGWFRGIEGDEAVKLEAPAPPAPPGPRSGLPAPLAAVVPSPTRS